MHDRIPFCVQEIQSRGREIIMKRRKSLLPAFIVMTVLAVASYGCGGKSQSKEGGEKAKEPVVPVEVAAVSSGDISAYFTGTATVEAEQETGVVAKVSGVVEELFVEEGDFVKAGAVLAKLDDEMIAVQLEQAKADLRKQENNFERNRDLHEKQLVSTEVFQQVQFEYERQKAAYDLAELSLQYTSIKTPISGVVSQRNVKVGNMVLQNQDIFRVSGLNPLIAVLHVPEKQLERMKTGQRAVLLIDALGGTDYEGYIKRISPIVDSGTGTVKVTVEVKDPTGRVRPGMFSRVKIIYDVHTGTTLAPKDAIIAEDRESAVFVVQDSTAYKRNVVLGYTNTTHVEILEGLMPGDTIVTTGKGSLKDSTKVEIVKSGGNK
jgi:membrane fusion protein (multidrug efflux system)